MARTVITLSTGRRPGHADRREAVNRRLAATADLVDRLSATLAGPPPDPRDGQLPLDPEGWLTAALPSLVAVAHRTPGFDLRVSCGPTQLWALRLHHAADDALVVQLVRAATDTRPEFVVDLTPSGPELVSELAGLLWAAGGIAPQTEPQPDRPTAQPTDRPTGEQS